MYLKLIATLLILVLHLKSSEAQWPPHWPLNPNPNPNPNCANQFALVNRACLLVPFRSGGTPSTPSLPGGDEVSLHLRRRSHSRHHRGHWIHAHRPETPQEGDCCRWLKEVDSFCACALLLHLPPFLITPEHSYTIIVDEYCRVTFQCGRLTN
ncbi:hypothetical protein ACS0TY_017355 [Phlomoides rotata]